MNHPTDFDLLLVIGGYNGTNLAEVELVSLDPDNYPVPPCLDNLKELPVARYAAAGALDEYGNPFLCGGVTFQSYQIIYNECFKYDPQRDSWEQHGTMPYYKGFIADTEVNGLGLVMVGGKGDSEGGEGVMYESTDDVIATTDGMTFQKLDQLPRASSKGETIQKHEFVHIPINSIAYFHAENINKISQLLMVGISCLEIGFLYFEHKKIENL